MANAKVPANRLDVTLILLLFVGGLLLRGAMLGATGFDGLYGQDSYAYYDFARELQAAAGEFRLPMPFFWPLGYPALLAIAHALFGEQPGTGQTVNILLGAGLAPLVYILTRQMKGQYGAALAGGVLMGVCGQALQSSLVIMADIPALSWATLSAVLLWIYVDSIGDGQHTRPPILVLSTLTLALACITRWLYLLLVVPWALALLIVWKGRVRWRDSIVAALAGSVILIPQLLYSRSNPYPVLNHAWVEGWSPANAFQAVFDNVDGHFEYVQINGVYYAQPFYDPYYLVPLFTPLLLVGIVRLWHQRRFAGLGLLLGWGLLPYLFLSGIPYQNIRFPLVVFPAVAVLAGFGLETGARWLANTTCFRCGSIVFIALLVLGATQTFSHAETIIRDFIEHQQEDKSAARWAAAQISASATLYTFGLTLTLRHYTGLTIYDLYNETPETLNQKWQRGTTDYLLLNVWNIENQWTGRDPQLNYHWLRDTRGLIRLGKKGYYTLYRVRG